MKWKIIADFFQYLHVLVIIIFLGGMVLIFQGFPYNLIAATYIILVRVSFFVYNKCILTEAETYFRKKENKKYKKEAKYFTAGFLKKYFNIELNDNLDKTASIVQNFFVVISIIIMIKEIMQL